MAEIDPDCSDAYLKHKFLQTLRSDIRSRLGPDSTLPVRELVRHAHHIESLIEQQKVDEKLKLAVFQSKKPLSNIVTNNLSIKLSDSPSSSDSPTSFSCLAAPDNAQTYDHSSPSTTISPLSDHPRRLPSPPTRHNTLHSSSNNHTSSYTHHSNPSPPSQHYYNSIPSDNLNHQHHLQQSHSSTSHRSPANHNSHSFSNSTDNSAHSTGPAASYSHSSNNNHSSNNPKTRWWCPHCQRHGHSWQRCPHNPYSINYQPPSSSSNPPFTPASVPFLPQSAPPASRSSFQHNGSFTENSNGR